MPIETVGDLNIERTIANDFSVTLARDEDDTVRILVTGALLAGEKVISNWSAEDITEELTQGQRNTARGLLRSAEIKVENLLGL